MMKRILILLMLLTPLALWRGVVGEARAQAPGPTPVKVSQEKQMMQGRKYYVHIVEKGQTVYSIAKAYRVQSYDAVTHVDVHSLHPGDTVWLPFRGQFADIEEPAAAAPAPTPAPVNTVYVHDTIIVTDTVTLTKTEYVTVHDTTYIAVRDTTYIDVPVHDTIFVAVRDTTYIDVLHTIHDTTVVTDTVRLTEYVPVHDTTIVTVTDTVTLTNTLTEYVPVHDTTMVTLIDTITLTNTLMEYVPVHDTIYVAVRDTTYIDVLHTVHDTTYINVPYTVHDTTIVTDKVTLTEYVPVHDTTIVTLTNTVTRTDTVRLTEYVPVHDTTYIAVHDTTYIDVPHTVQNTTIVTDTVRVTEYVPVHDTTIVTLTDTITLTNTVTLTDTVKLTEYVPVHDTTYIAVHDTTYIDVPHTVQNTTIVTDTVKLTEYVPVHDTMIVTLTDTVTLTNTVTRTDTVTLTEYVPVHDTTYIAVHDTTYIDVPHTVQNTTIVTDTVRLTEYVPVHDTTIIRLTDTITLTNTVTLTDTVKLTEYVPVHDTTIVTLTDTVRLTEYVPVHDTTYIAVHDTTFVTDTVEVPLAPASDLAFASTSAVPLTDYLPASQPATSQDDPTESERKSGKALKVALMMPLHLDQIDQISTSKFDIEQRGKKSYRQFEFIEFYEGVLLALDKLAEQGISVQLNVVDVSTNTPAQVEEAFVSHNVAQSDFVVALLLRDCFDKAAELARQAGVYIVNPMATRSELCAENPYMVKIQPSLSGMITLMLNNMKVERPDAHLYIIHSNSKAEKPAMDELKRQLTERGDIKYTIFNWSQSAKLASVMKATPKCNVVSIYDQDKDNNRVFCINLLNRLSSIKKDSPTLYTLNDWTREYGDIDFAQLQLLNYHTYSQGWDMTNDVHVQFLQSFRNRFGSEPTSQLAATGHDLMLYIVGGLSRRSSEFWRNPGNSLPTLIQPLHLSRNVAGLENDKAQLYRMEDLRFVKALFK